VHLGGYGADIDSDLYSLTQAVLQETDIPRIRFGSLEPWDLHEEFFALFENERVMPHLHLPLQSGSESVLKRMSRRCKTADYAALVDSARRAIPDFNITTDIIVGFPGETDAEWREGLAFIESIGFGHTHIFAFSPRTGTKAATLDNPVTPAVIKERSNELHMLAAKMKRDFMLRHAGKTSAVLLEGKVDERGDGRYQYYGYTSNYLRIAVEFGEADLGNRIVSMRMAVSGAPDDDALTGLIE